MSWAGDEFVLWIVLYFGAVWIHDRFIDSETVPAWVKRTIVGLVVVVTIIVLCVIFGAPSPL